MLFYILLLNIAAVQVGSDPVVVGVTTLIATVIHCIASHIKITKGGKQIW